MMIKKKIAISITIVSTITGLIVYFIILPTIYDIKKISDDIYNERADLEKKYLRGQLLNKTVEDFERIKPEQDKLISVFLIEGEELKFITALEEIAATNNLGQDLHMQQNKNEGRTKNNYYLLPVKINTQGTFIQTLAYLKDLEKLNYYFNISSMTLNANDKNGLIAWSINGNVYTLPNNKNEEEL